MKVIWLLFCMLLSLSLISRSITCHRTLKLHLPMSSSLATPAFSSSTPSSSSSASAIFSSMGEMEGQKKKIIVLAGPTAVGKSAVAALLCKNLPKAEIVVADSVQIYRHMDIGSNKPSLEEQAAVPHHMVDICEPREQLSSGEFVERVAPIIHDILKRGGLPVLVGGSTMWMQWYVCVLGLFPRMLLSSLVTECILSIPN